MTKIAVVCSEFNKDRVEKLYDQAQQAFEDYNKQKYQIYQPDQNNTSIKKLDLEMAEPFWVPGSGEIPFTVDYLLKKGLAQAVLALGLIIRGQTGHYDFLCGFLQKALWDLQKTNSMPIVFSILMTENKDQAEERIKKGRGAEGMKSLIHMIELQQSLEKSNV